jgi:hypothetical protein
MLFANDVVLVDESQAGVNRKLKLWRQTLEFKGFRVSQTKTEYMRCDFGNATHEEGDVSLEGQVVPTKDTFHYLGLMLPKDGDVDADVCQRIKAGWMKWHQASGWKASFIEWGLDPLCCMEQNVNLQKRRHVQQPMAELVNFDA